MYEESLSKTNNAQYIGRLVLWGIGMTRLEVCKEEKDLEGERWGFIYPSPVRMCRRL